VRPKLPSPALVLSFLALFAAFAGGAIAAGKITGSQIKNGSITGSDIKNDSLTGSDIKGQIKGDDGSRGPTGPAGPRGPTGGTGTVTYRGQPMPVQAGESRTATAICPDGMVVTGGGTYPAVGAISVSYDRPVMFGSGNEVPNAWEAGVSNSGDEDGIVIVYAACVAAAGQLAPGWPF
jgi:hypothetical protein